MQSEISARRWIDYLPLILLLAIGLVIRLWTLNYGINVDEGDYLMQGRELARGFWPYVDVHLNKPPLVSFLAYPFFLFTIIPILPVRVFMILVSLSAIVALYKLVREEFGELAALAAAGLLAFDPYQAIWSKYLHVSTLAPTLALWAVTSWLLALKKKSTNWALASGVLASLCLLNKQTGITILPVLGFIFLLYANRETVWKAAGSFLAGFVLLPALLLLALASKGGLEPFLYDTWYSNLRMGEVFEITAGERWAEFKAVAFWNPVGWYGASLGVLTVLLIRKRLGFVLVAWLGIEFGLNIFGLSHVWQHYVMAIMPPAYALTGIFMGWLGDFVAKRMAVLADLLKWSAPALALLLTAPFWGRANWEYPNITLTDEKALAAYLDRNCPEPYLLCFVNAAFYMWTDKDVPLCMRGERLVRIPPFMNTAGRGYLSVEDMKKTVALWETLDIGFCAMYGKYYQQIFEERDPLLEPVRVYLETNFVQSNVLNLKPTYYAQMVCFKKKVTSDE